MVTDCIKSERLRKGAYQKLQSKNVSRYKIVKKIQSNAYVLELQSDMGVRNEHLILYFGHEAQAVIWLPPTPNLKEEIEDVLDDQIVSTRSGGYQELLVKWTNFPLSKYTWFVADEF